MNTYKITYTIPSTGESDEFTTVAPTETRAKAALRRTLLAADAWEDGCIEDVELVGTDAQATKEQELEGLKKIREIVELMGPNSYIATALAGCLDDAEDNIRDDAAYSMKDRYESARAEVEALRSKVKSLESGIDELVQKDDERKAALGRLGRKVLSDELYTAIRDLAQEDRTAARQRMEESAETMAALAETPQDIAFTAAVTGYREAKKRRALCEGILTGLENMSEE